MTRPRPDWRGWTLAALAITLLLALALTADGQEVRTPGVGLPGVPHPEFVRQWCNEKRPGGCSHRAPAGFDCFHCPSAGWTGHRNENYQRSEQLLRTCWEKDVWGTKASYTGQHTSAELEWAQVAVPTTGPLSRTCWYDAHEIGGESHPIVLTDLTAERYWASEVRAAQLVGAWRLGVFAYGGYDPVLGGRVSAEAILDEQGRPRRGLWPVWLDNRTTGATPEPEPHPAPAPQPPPPVPPPTCEPYAGSTCEARCVQVRRDREWCLDPERENGARLLFGLCSGVCRDGEPPPEPPPPEPEEPPVLELECWEGRATARFIPGVPSTGRLQVEMFRVDCPEESP